jgi:hypothetical protein
MRAEAILRILAGLAIAFAILLLRASPAHALACTGTASAYPYFGIDLLVSGPGSYSLCDYSAVSNNIAGVEGPFASGSASASAALNTLGAKATANNTAPAGSSGNAYGEAIANWADLFPINGGFAILAIQVSLVGNLNAAGAGFSSVGAEFDGFGGRGFGAGDSVQLSSPGLATIHVPIMPGGDVLFLGGTLFANASANEFGDGTSNFLTTFEITGVQGLDADGNFVQDVTLVDEMGNTLPVATPEPPAGLLLACGLLGLAAWRRASASRG